MSYLTAVEHERRDTKRRNAIQRFKWAMLIAVATLIVGIVGLDWAVWGRPKIDPQKAALSATQPSQPSAP